MVGRLFHRPDVVVDPGIVHPRVQRGGGQDQVDAQPAARIVLEPAAAVVEPAEAVGDLGIERAEAVGQAPRLEPYVLELASQAPSPTPHGLRPTLKLWWAARRFRGGRTGAIWGPV